MGGKGKERIEWAASVTDCVSSRSKYHGDCETWQCSGPCEGKKLWRAPQDYVFDVDPETMLAIPKRGDYVPKIDAPERCTSRLDPSMFQSAEFTQRSFSGPFPRCPDCGKWARPSILMFNSDDTKLWVRKQAAEDNWNAWDAALTTVLRRSQGKVVIIEVGAGVNVPSLRFHSERLLKRILENHRNAPAPVLIRINPDHPEAEETKLRPYVVSISSRGLDALKKLESALDSKRISTIL